MMMVDVYDTKGEVVGKKDIREEVFGAKENEALVYETVRVYLANLRRGTASTKRRGEVRGSGRKPWRQKGTGRARVGSIRSPLRRGGGVVFGPKPRSYRTKIPSKIKRASLLALLSSRLSQGKIKIVDRFDLPEPKTSILVKILKDLGVSRPLIVLNPLDRSVLLSSSNIEGVEVVSANELNAYDIISHEYILFTLEAIKGLEERILAHG
jgi:large subunit ribosomal protein L4